jgi:hypothetical protein
LVQDNKHRALLQFLRRIMDIPSLYDKGDLVIFRSLTSRGYPALLPIVEEYVRLAERSDSDVLPPKFTNNNKKTKASPKVSSSTEMHLFDLLRERRLFQSNSDLAEFAGRVLPKMSRHRFDKMSRGDIAARIIEYLETRNRSTRERLEASMRGAMESGPDKASDRRSFFSQWEKIIKGIEF